MNAAFIFMSWFHAEIAVIPTCEQNGVRIMRWDNTTSRLSLEMCPFEFAHYSNSDRLVRVTGVQLTTYIFVALTLVYWARPVELHKRVFQLRFTVGEWLYITSCAALTLVAIYSGTRLTNAASDYDLFDIL